MSESLSQSLPIELQPPLKKGELNVNHWIGDTWVKGDGPVFQVHSPYNGSLIGAGAAASSALVEQALTVAEKAFEHWRWVPIKERSAVLFQFRQLLLRDIDGLSNLICSESGKIFSEARAEILKGIEVTEFALSLQNSDQTQKLEVSRGVSCEFRREPLGVVAAITPFNFPAMVPMWMIPIALVAGNCLVWKPSEKVPLTALKIAELLKQAGLPSGVFTVLHGAKDLVEALCLNKRIQAIGFVGSSAIADKVYQMGAATHKRVLALGGAKNHLIVMPDAEPQMTAQGIVDSFTGCAGQRCMAASVLLAVGEQGNSAIESTLTLATEKASKMRLGFDMGALISSQSLFKIRGALERALASGSGSLRLDGRETPVPQGCEAGFWLGPTILDQVVAGSEAACDELFGPVLSIIRVPSLSEALTIQKSNPYGNAASVFTQSAAIADRVMKEAHAGMIGVNIGVPVPREPFSFGGIGLSRFGHGDITGMQGLEFWTQLKKVTSKWVMQSDQNWMS